MIVSDINYYLEEQKCKIAQKIIKNIYDTKAI